MKRRELTLCQFSHDILHKRGIFKMSDVKTQKVKQVETGSLVSPKGFQVTGLHSGVKRKRNDLGVIYSEQPASAAAVYTLNKIKAAPITVTQSSMSVEN